MSAPFSRPGAVDLSALKSSATGGQPAAAPGSPAGGAYTVEITADNFQTEMQRSTQLPVALCFYSPQSPDSVELAQTLSRVGDELDGKVLVALLDVDANPQLAQSIGVPGVPLFAIALQGQLQPVAQQNLPEADVRSVLEQVVQSAVANGMTGRVQPRAGTETGTAGEEAEPEADPKYAEADEAVASGDLDAAVAAYQRLLQENPGDDQARTGLARVQLVARTRELDADAARSAAADNPGDVEAQIRVADVDLLGGHVEDAFDRLVGTVRRVGGEERDRARTHLLELFEIVGNDDPRVRTFRGRLASALF